MLCEELERWDGQRVAALQDIFNRRKSSPEFLTDAIEACHQQNNVQIGGAWMVKEYISEGGFLEEIEEERWFAAIRKLIFGLEDY
jgi:hypothetical protein